MRTFTAPPPRSRRRRGPRSQPDQGVERVGEVGLEDDAGLDGEELRLVEQLGEGVEGEREIAVLLHVEVDERRG